MTVSSGDAHPFPIYNARYRVTFPILDADGDLVTAAASPDSEASQNSGTFADCTNEATELATSSGMYYLDLIATELDTKVTAIIVKTATAGAKTTPIVLYPKRMPQIRTGTAQAGAATTITLDASASAIDDYYNGCYVNITNDSPANALGQARLITDYAGSTKVATVEAAWGTNPTVASTFEVLATDTWIERLADVNAFGGIASTQAAGRPEVNTTHAAGTAWGSGAITAASIAADAITAAKVADGTIDAATFAAGAINAAAIATGAVDADALAADAGTEIAAAVWNEDATGHQTLGTFGQAVGDPVADTDTIYALANSILADTDDIQTRLPAALVSGRMDSSVGAMAAGVLTAAAIASAAITAAKFGAGAVDAAALATDAAQEIADELLKRNVSNVEATAPEHSLATIVLAILESAVSGTTWTIKRTDGTTTHATKTVATDAAANPIVTVS